MASINLTKKISLEQGLKLFKQYTGDAMEAVYRRARIYYKLTHDDIEAKHAFIEQFQLSITEQRFLYCLGSGKLYKQFALCHTYRMAIEVYNRHITKYTQYAMIHKGLDIVVDAAGTVVNKPFNEIEATDIMHVFDEDGVQYTEEAQAKALQQEAELVNSCSIKVKHKSAGCGGHETSFTVRVDKTMVRKLLLNNPPMFTPDELRAIADRIENREK